MGDSGEPHEHHVKPTFAARREGAGNYTSHSAVDYETPCTAKDDQECHVVHHLTKWNAWLYSARFELQELPIARGRLSLVSFSDSGIDLPVPSEAETSQSYRALYWLVAMHRCIVTLNTPEPRYRTPETLLFDALKLNKSLKFLKLQFLGMEASTDIAGAIRSLTGLEEIECALYKRCPANLVSALCTLLRSPSSLTAIRMLGSFLNETESKVMLAALISNSTLKEFCMEGSMAEESNAQQFTDYLRTTTTLTTLRMTARNARTQHSLLRGVLQNRTITSLSLTRFICDEESTRLVARVFIENEVLETVDILSTQESLRPSNHRNCDWVAALSENNTLKQLSFPLSIWPIASWTKFARVLSVKSNLKKVTIKMDSANFNLLTSVCRALSASGVEEKVSCGTYLVIDNLDLIKCKAFSEIYLFSGTAENLRLQALRKLPECAHLSYVALDIPKGNIPLSSGLADCLKSAPHLQKLQLSIGWSPDMTENLPNEWWKKIMSGLSTSKSLRELLMCANGLNAEDFEALADAVRQSRSIRTFYMMHEISAHISIFVRRLSTGVAENYALREVRLHGRLDAEATSSWFVVCETTRRNSGILTRAAHFKEGRQLDRYVAEALERVSLHSALMEDFADFLHSTKEATALFVQAHIRSFEPIDPFMRLAGIVKNRVVCHPRDDGVTQLDDLNKDCWSHVRRFLMLEDIKSAV